jgi:hypothetical protein
MLREFRLAPRAAHLLNAIVSETIIEARCIAPSLQSVIPEPGFLCQELVLQIEGRGFVIKSICEDFGDVEVFWLSVTRLNEVGIANYNKMNAIRLSPNTLGQMTGWRAIAETITFERKAAEPLKAHIDSGLLFQFDGDKRLLVMTAPLPFFIQCFTKSVEIDSALAAAV